MLKSVDNLILQDVMNTLQVVPKQHTEKIQGDLFFFFFHFVPIYLFPSTHCATLLPLKTGAVSSWQKENSRDLHWQVLIMKYFCLALVKIRLLRLLLNDTALQVYF